MIYLVTWALPAARAFRCKSSPFLPATPTRAVGFTLQSLTRPPHNIAKYFTSHHDFFRVALVDTHNKVVLKVLT
jgi:hypothetical protein